jgi:hypothetical protein
MGITIGTKSYLARVHGPLIPASVAVETSELMVRRATTRVSTDAPFSRVHWTKEQAMPADIWTFPPTAESVQFLIGYEVEAIDGSVGKIDANSLRADSSFLVIDTGWWIFERKRLIPAGLITSISGTKGKIYLAMTKRDVKAAPAYRPIEHSSESGRYNDFYGST